MFFFWVFVVVALFVLTLWAVTVAGRLRPAGEAVVAAAGQASQPLAVAFVVLLTAALLGALAWAGFMAWHMTGGWRGWMPHMGWTGNPVAQTPVVTEAQEVTVRMRGDAFVPSDLTVRPGAVVIWVNEDPVPHSATAKDWSWDTGLFGAGESRRLSFSQPGVWEYVCVIHPGMEGVIRVQPA